jgi:hypothetical protein
VAERRYSRSDDALAVGFADALGDWPSFDDVACDSLADRERRLRAEDLEDEVLDRALKETSGEHCPGCAGKRACDFRLLPCTVPGAFRIVRIFLELGRIDRAERLRGAQGSGTEPAADQGSGGSAFGTCESAEPAADDPACNTARERRIGLRKLVSKLRSDP